MTRSKSERVAQLCGVGGFNDNTAPYANTYYQAAAGGGAPDGSGSMTRVVVFSPVRPLSAFFQMLFVEGYSLTGNGWFVYWSSSQYKFLIRDTDGPVNHSVTLTPTKAPKSGEVCVLQCSYDGSDLHICCKGEVATNNAGSGLGFTPSSNRLSIGGRDGSTEYPAKDLIIHAALATDSAALSLAQMAAAEAQIIEDMEQGKDIQHGLFAAAMEHYWNAEDVVIGPGPLGVTWPDRIGSSDIVKVGEPQGFGVQARF